MKLLEWKSIISIKVFVIVLSVADEEKGIRSSKNELHQRLDELNYGMEITNLIEDILKHVPDINCLARICDETYEQYFEQNFFLKLGYKTVFNVLIDEAEDLLAPNYKTLVMIQEIRRAGCNVYFILLANGDQAARFLRFGDRHRILDTRANFLMIYDTRLFNKDLHYLWKKIVNIVFFRRYGTARRFELTTVPFPAPIKRTLIPKRINSWFNGKFQNIMGLYRDKTANLNQQTLNVVVIDHIPSVVKTRSENRNDIVELDSPQKQKVRGLEIQMLKTLQSVLNFKSYIYMTANSETEAWGKKQLNGSYSGMLGEIWGGRADIALGNLYYTAYHLDLMDLSVPYATQCLTFLTPESLTDNSWQTLVLPFKFTMWIGIITTLVVGGVSFFAMANVYHHLHNNNDKRLQINKIKKHLNKLTIALSNLLKRFNDIEKNEGLYLFDSIDNGILYTFSMLTLVSLPKLPSGWALRVMTGWWWIYCLLIVVAYRASMTAILANPMPRVMIDTVEQLASSTVRCGGWGEENKKSFINSIDPAGREIGRKFDIIDDPLAANALGRIADGEFSYYDNMYWLQNARVKYWISLARGAARGDLQNVTDDQNNTESRDLVSTKLEHNLHLMSDCVINMPISLGLQKNSPLKPQMDKFIRSLIEAGLVQKWLADVMLDTMIMEAKSPLGSDQNNIKALVDLPKLYAGFVALLIGYAISILFLILEIVHWMCIVKKDPTFDKYDLKTYYHLR
ncbi:hypothetical protein LSTR_LSTR001483 [Laodelphax striatellus]|uniref:Ionotropic glutamate receptor L-glutamate and glycine-binding domain-containing protein n=1 Tax=Laodelphax striatellus TaxID=195883 RepID=A0A482XB39_LAOST|nr:hypothetical protein LSTR_LSTR001483 [Laodelphax striatellus]